MRPLAGIFPVEQYPELLVGLLQPDDAAVYALTPDRAIVSTVDFFPPVVDNPYEFGAIAAANALSDIYAMGAEPIFAINLVAFPDGLGMELLTEILRGGAEKVREAGAVIAGGHTVTDREPKYGLAVTGLVDPSKLLTKGGARPGDLLLLTKQLGTGVITTALKRELADQAHVQTAVDCMRRLNRDASRLAVAAGAHAMTDVTGYSFLGHGHEMAHLSGVDFDISLRAFQWLPGAHDYAEQGIFAGGLERNREYFSQWVDFAEDVDAVAQSLLFDPQTSGGLLIAIGADAADALLAALQAAGDTAFIVGQVREGSGRLRVTA